ncbi:2-octaprenyl-6-methoxyphenyl hydroxylase [Devosia pacifica]|uniref:2-octaprenyl-6-methoxyphenyl hydroxylase n=1 Tax=Devosia pacifica TaxID=1335967 RepID=A0A918RST6_9HYPH|nr:FAD-dependent monooxygenase [Devosia pacifica]GHA11483.1 2-octaprenyl-6-methoxyphenyl hydroxylase [Devosia pacifica]
MTDRTDAIVVGGGLTGLAAAIALARAGLDVIHAAPGAAKDQRTSALMQPVVDYLVYSGLIEDPASLGYPLRRIRIIDATNRLFRAPESLFKASDMGLDAFGWNFANSALNEAFSKVRASLPNLSAVDSALVDLKAQESTHIAVLADEREIEAPLIVGADGKRSFVRRHVEGFVSRERQFEQSALVCDLELQKPLNATSVEFHYPNGPFTLVPAEENRANLVWIDRQDVLQHIIARPDAEMIEALAQKSQRLFGDIKMATKPAVFPLNILSVRPLGRRGVVLVGESGHAFPPIGAQGLNLGLRDVEALAEVVKNADRSDSNWGQEVSDAYAVRRATDVTRTGGMVDALFRSLLSEHLPAQMLRAGGLWGLNALPALRKQAMSIGMGRQ